jgi:hypothetical protein
LARISGTRIIGSMAPPYLFLSHPSYFPPFAHFSQ